MRVRHPKAKGASERAKMIEREADSYESTKKKRPKRRRQRNQRENNNCYTCFGNVARGWLKNTPQNRISLGIQVSICHATKRSGKHQSSEKRKARPRMTKRRRTGKPKKSFPTHNSRHRLRTLAERMTPRWKLCVGMRVCKCAFGSLMEGGKPPNEGKSPNRICCKGWCYPTVSCGVGKSPSQSFLLRREADNIILR